MTDRSPPIDWGKTTFDGSRREQLRQAQRMTVRQRLEALDQLSRLSERIQTMPRATSEEKGSGSVAESRSGYQPAPECHEIALEGCTSGSLVGYLKSLGILRLVAEQVDAGVRGYWANGTFVIRTSLSKEQLSNYFLNYFRPSPIISPWSGRAGFLEGNENQKSKRKGAVIIDRVEQSNGVRFEIYRNVVASVKDVSVITRLDKTRVELKQLEKQKKSRKIDSEGLKRLSILKLEDKKLKGAILLSLRGELDEKFLPWIDACFALTMDERTPGPLLGSGGNEGSMDFSINHVGYLLNLIDENTDKPTPLAINLLSNCLFGAASALGSKSNIGFLDTLATGGINMSTGFDGHCTGNTWDSVLAMEGAVLFASATTKKLESTRSGRPSFPFAVSPTYAGEGGIATNESARPELWLPVWNAPVSVQELSALLAEGRTTLGKRQVERGLDMLRAMSSLGVNRGITAFERYGFFERRGQGYYVTSHIGTHSVPTIAVDNWVIRDLGHGGWLNQFRRSSLGKHAANRFPVLYRRLEERFFALAGREPSKAEAQSLLILLGEIQLALAGSSKTREDVRPVPLLSEQWVTAADNGTPAFRIAKALAGLRGFGEEPLPLRAQLFPVQRKYQQWMTPDANEKARIYTGQKGRLTDTLRSLLERRLWLARELEMADKPLASPAGVTLDDINAFLRDDRMDIRIAALLPGLALCKIPRDVEHGSGSGTVPAAFALMKLSLTPDHVLQSLGLLPETNAIPVPAGLVAQLAAGNAGNRAVQSAWRRLRSSGLSPLFSPAALPSEESILPQRAAAALLIPLRYGATAELTRSVLKPVSNETDNEAV